MPESLPKRQRVEVARSEDHSAVAPPVDLVALTTALAAHSERREWEPARLLLRQVADLPDTGPLEGEADLRALLHRITAHPELQVHGGVALRVLQLRGHAVPEPATSHPRPAAQGAHQQQQHHHDDHEGSPGDEHAAPRETMAKRLQRVLDADADADAASDAETVAGLGEAIEREIERATGGDRAATRSKFQHLVFNLKANAALRADVRRGAIAPERLVAMRSDELAADHHQPPHPAPASAPEPATPLTAYQARLPELVVSMR